MITIHIENKPYQVKEGQNLLHACLSLGFDIPYFCWHPAMHSVGACRQCAVREFKDEKDTRGKIVMSCMTPLREGMRISIDDAEAKSFRKSIIELLMLNHPHDCPVCDEGGECHLQDMTVMTGHVYRRTRFRKRSYVNQYLGPFVAHEMNRCIQCYRCVRYYRDYAGGRDLDVFGAHDHVYFGRHKDGVLENEFSGNLVEICPTGVFTDKTFQQRYTRKWDLQTAPSICVHCGVGCNTIPGERYGDLRRIRARYNGEVNRYFLCDRGRFGYEFVNSNRRIRRPLIGTPSPTSPTGEGAQPVSREAALARIKDILSGSKGIIGIGSPRASLESNFALRTLVGAGNFYAGMSDNDVKLAALILEILRKGPARSPSLREMESCDAVFVLGEDVTNTAPVVALSLRQAARHKERETARKQRVPLWDDAAVRNAVQGIKPVFYIAAPYRTRLDDIAADTYHAAPDDIARFGFAVAHAVNPGLPEVDGIDDATRSSAASIAKALQNAKQPLIVSGSGCGSEEVVRAAANIAWALCDETRTACLSLVVPECNTLGLALMNAPGLGPALQSVQEGKIDTAFILENDLFRRAGQKTIDGFFKKIKHMIVMDDLTTRTSSGADVALPAAAFPEASGTLVNNEGRSQRFYQVFVPAGDIRESWRWLREIMEATGLSEGKDWKGLDDVSSSLAQAMPVFSEIRNIAPPAGFRMAGMRIPRKPHRYSGRTAMFADTTVFEPKPPKDPDSPLAFSMEGYAGKPPAALIPRFWAPGWNSPQAINKFQAEVGGPLLGGDPGKRLIELSPSGQATFFKKVPDPFARRRKEWLFVPLFHIFGSEEKSLLSPGIAELSPDLYVGINLGTSGAPDLREGQEVSIRLDEIIFFAPIKHVEGLPAGVAALPANVGKIVSAVLPEWGTISRATQPPGVAL